ncbi:ABC transporter permease family protein [Neorhodopirellula pilleata]|uniref:ABC transmembrane type-1 domain-containing protein n=1 Tax=Neorhodopirellula pilleata TaxID=2714738 RepID=A0A5C5ZZG2_9BACT|nr:amino acid ABC transporter permease [Neorhodopirellula pilleata]TWT92536.1 hypothetical protein Pla100_45540 [Neorhodopirellula pilleata]
MADDWGAALVTTFALMAVSSILAVVIGIPSAIAATFLADKGAIGRDREVSNWSRVCRLAVPLWIAAMLFAIATPLILHAAAWESTAGKFGWLVKTMTGGNLLWVGWIHGVHGSAIVGLLSFWAIRNIPDLVLQHASIDMTPWRVWWNVRLSLARPWIALGVVLVGLVAATEMSVADLHSVRTVADQFYLFYALDPTMTSVMMVLVVPFVLASIPCSVWYLSGHSGFYMDMAHRRSPSQLICAFSPGMAVSSFMALLWLILSLLVCQTAMFVGLVLQAGHAVRVEGGRAIASWSWTACVRSLAEAPSMFAQEYAWTIQLACLTTIVVIPLACVVGRRSRTHPRSAKATDAAMVALFVIPGPLVAMGIVRLFAFGVPGFETLATQTLIPTMMAVGVRSFVIAYLILRFAYSQISESVWQSARLDASSWRRIISVELPAIWPAVLIASIASAIIASGDVPASLPVLPPGVTTVGTRLFGLLHSGARYQEASLAFWYFAALLVLGTISWVIVKRRMVLS